MAIQILDAAQLVRAINVNKTSPHSFFLGAGASISSGVKSAYDCIWEWKRQIFISSNPGLEKLFPDASSLAARNRIQAWLDGQNKYPEIDSRDEYTFYANEAYPIPSTRKSFFQSISKEAKPSPGYHILCLLARERVVRKVWTTNFDHLVAKAASSYNLTPIEIGLDSVHRIDRIAAEGELLICALHGDYRYDQLKNTDDELKEQDAKLKEELIADAASSHMLVLGFSGRDKSVMEALEIAYSKNGSGRLYWCGYDPEPNAEIENLLETAAKHNREAYYVRTNGFDDLLMRLGKFCLTGESYKEAEPHFKRVDSLKNEFTPFDLRISYIDSVIKSNLLPLQIPTELFQLDSPIAKEVGAWKKIREITKDKNIVAAPLKKKILALGTLTEISKCFEGNIDGSITRIPIDLDELNIENGTVKHLLTSALTVALAHHLNLQTDRRDSLWGEIIQTRTLDGIQHAVHKSLRFEIVKDENNLYLLLMPKVRIIREDGEGIDKEVKKNITKEIADKTYNGQFNTIFEEWRKRIFNKEESITLEYPEASGTGFNFVIHQTPLYSKVEQSKHTAKSLPDNSKYYRFSAKHFEEPSLLFSSKNGQAQISDSHPLIGLIKNRPYDFSLSVSGLSRETVVAVVCPSSHSQKFLKFLQLQLGSVPVTNQRENYAIDFPGYSSVYGINLNLPAIGGDRWYDLKLDTTLSPEKNTQYIADQIKNAVTRIASTTDINVVAIFIPTLWEGFRGYQLGNESFDLHDHVKAFAIQKGITTQFIEEDTVDNRSQANRIHWWLSLSLYCKTMRTPWVLDNLDPHSAFAGIGYSIDSTEDENHVVMGCSHIYNSRGEGLRYRLAKVDRPIFRHKRPHLSYEDAFQFGISTVQLFVEATNEPPKRVVIHKRTFFTEEEKRGILDGLKSIPVVDLVEINIEDDLRFINSVRDEDRLKIDLYPVARGICIQLNSFTGLLYTHGTTPSIRTGSKDFMGGRGIPAPLVIKKHHGPSSLETLATEILSLSKMNWNAASLYSKLPATIQSSNDIARIGAMLSRFSGKSYDYRLFI